MYAVFTRQRAARRLIVCFPFPAGSSRALSQPARAASLPAGPAGAARLPHGVVRHEAGAGDPRGIPLLQDLSRGIPQPEKPQLSAHVLRAMHREPRDVGVDVQEVQRLSRLHVPTVPQADAAADRWREEAARQLPRVESLRSGRPPEAVKVPVLRHLQDGQPQAPRGLLQVPRLQQAAVFGVCRDAQGNEGDGQPLAVRRADREGYRVQGAPGRGGALLLRTLRNVHLCAVYVQRAQRSRHQPVRGSSSQV